MTTERSSMAQQRPGDFDPHQTFRSLNGRIILWTGRRSLSDNLETHVCKGADVHPDVRLLWTLCEIDVPANEAFILPDGVVLAITCRTCCEKFKERQKEKP